MTLHVENKLGRNAFCLWILPAFVAAMASCSGDADIEQNGQESEPTAAPPAESVHRLRMFIGTGENTQELSVRPARGLWSA